MTVAEMADYAAAVFIGTVMARDSVKHDDARGIETTVTFGSLTWLKGAPAGAADTFDLVVPGGRVGPWTARLAGAPRLELDDRVLLFVLPQYALHPVVGVMRGAVRISLDADGVERVTSMGGAITGLTADGFLDIAAPQPCAACAAHRATPEDSRTHIASHGAADVSHALSLDAFVTMIDPIIRASAAHPGVDRPGRRRIVRHRAVPIVTRPSAGATR